ncbi:4252_t:CDS:2, partial [Scutellospora calospora]
ALDGIAVFGVDSGEERGAGGEVAWLAGADGDAGWRGHFWSSQKVNTSPSPSPPSHHRLSNPQELQRDADSPAVGVLGEGGEHAFEFVFQVVGHALGTFGAGIGGDEPLFASHGSDVRGSWVEKRKGKERTTHLRVKLLNAVVSRLLLEPESNQVIGVVLLGTVLAVHIRNTERGLGVDGLLDGGLELVDGDVPVAAAHEVVVPLAGELEAVVARAGRHADHELVHGIGGEVGCWEDGWSLCCLGRAALHFRFRRGRVRIIQLRGWCRFGGRRDSAGGKIMADDGAFDR